jgi:GNAT superfamily N-acetyltransferase
MEWQFDNELQDQIIYSMENQDGIFFLDIRTGNLVANNEIKEKDIGKRYHRLPGWRSLEGYQLMERFVSSVRNPLFREELRGAISTGKGVFRNFKNVLKKRKELEKLWFSFKEREMKSIILDWYNRIRESEGLEKLSPPPEEETEELVSSDFSMTTDVARHLDRIHELDRQVILDSFPGREESRVLSYYEETRKALPKPEDEQSLTIVAETPGGDFVGFAWGVEREDPPNDGMIIDLVQLAVVPEYQGLGLGQALLKRLIELATETDATKVHLHLTGRFLNAARLFEPRGFTVSSQTMELDLSLWEKEQV